MLMGTPCRGPSASPFITASSAARASRRTRSSSTCTKAFSVGLSRSIFARCASASSAGEIFFARTCSAIATAERKVGSFIGACHPDRCRFSGGEKDLPHTTAHVVRARPLTRLHYARLGMTPVASRDSARASPPWSGPGKLPLTSRPVATAQSPHVLAAAPRLQAPPACGESGGSCPRPEQFRASNFSLQIAAHLRSQPATIRLLLAGRRPAWQRCAQSVTAAICT